MDLKTYLSGERGRLSTLSKAIGAHAPDVSRWASGTRPIPISFGLPIERETGGLVTRQEMFSQDTLAKVWPELVTPKNGITGVAASDDTQPPVGGETDSEEPT